MVHGISCRTELVAIADITWIGNFAPISDAYRLTICPSVSPCLCATLGTNISPVTDGILPGGVDAQMAVDLVCENNGAPLRFPMAFNAIADNVRDIIGIKVLWEEERFQYPFHLRCRALITRNPPTIWMRIPGQPMRMSWMACMKLKSMRNSTAIPTIW